MQQSLSLVFQETQTLKRERRELNRAIKEGLDNNKAYQNAKIDYDRAKENLKTIKKQKEEEYSKEIEKSEELKRDISDKQIIMADLAINKITKGESLDIESDKGVVFSPEFSVKFKRTGTIVTPKQ